MFKVPGTQGSAVVHVQFSGQASFQKSFLESIQIGNQGLREVKPTIGDQAGMVIEEGDQIALAHLLAHSHHGTMHHIALPLIPQAE
jgi:homospermidine synthase